MKKSELVSLMIGSAVIITGAVAYVAAKAAGKNVRPKHDPKDQVLNTPYVPEEAPDEAEEVLIEEEAPEEAEEVLTEEETPEEAEEVLIEEEAPEREEVLFEESDDAAEFADYVAPAEKDAEEEAPAEEAAEDEAPAEGPVVEQEYSNLEEYIELNPEERKDLEAVNDSFAAEGVKTDISFSENTMFFDFVMTDVEDDETKEILKPDLEKFLDDQADTYRDLVNKIEQDTGIDGIRMIVIFMDENEDQIVSGHYDSTGRTM